MAIELSALETLSAGDLSIAKELVDLFIEDSADQVQNLERCIQERDEETVKRLAHTLKSSCAAMGAMDSSALCASIEAGGVAVAADLFVPLQASLARAESELKAFCHPVQA